MPATRKTKKKSKTESKRTTAKKTSSGKSTTKKTAASTKRKSGSTGRKEITRESGNEIPELPLETKENKDQSIDEISGRISDVDDISVSIEPPYIPPPPGEYGISRKVLARIASMAAGEIQGLVPPRKDPICRFIDTINGRTDGIKIEVGTTEAAVDMLIRVQYGSHIPELTSRLREKIATRIHEMTGLNVVEINVRVQDVTPSPPAQH